MNKRTIYLSAYDIRRLKTLIKENIDVDEKNKKHLFELDNELNRGKIFEPQEIPGDVITMNSRVCVQDMVSDEEFIWTLVFPGEADVDNNKISILSPVGTALIGYRIGSIVEWGVPGGVRKLKVKEILYQPEAAGQYHL